MTTIIPTLSELQAELDMEVIVSEEDTTVYVKLSGFDTIEDADTYAEYLTKNLPLLLFQSEIIH